MRWRWPPENSCGYLPKAPAVQADLAEQRARALLALGLVGADAVDRHRLDQRLADREARVQARVRVLEHDLDAPAHRLALARRSASAGCGRRTSPRRAVGLVQAQQRQPHRRLARARFADHAQRVAAAQLEVDVLHGLELALAEQALRAARSSWPARAPRAPPARSGPSASAAGARGAGRRCGRRSPSAAPGCRPGSAGRPAAPWCRRPAALRRCAPPAPARARCRGASPPPGRRSRPPAPRSWLMNSTLMRWLLLQLGEQLEDLALDRHVERGGRLVGDQQLGLAGQRHRDHHALLLAARQLVRVARRAAASARACRPRPAAPRRARSAARRPRPRCLHQRLGELLADGEHRVQRASSGPGTRRRSPCRAAPAARPAPAFSRSLALPQDAAGALGVVGQQVEDRHRGHALARARFADQRHGGVLGDVEAHALDGFGR